VNSRGLSDLRTFRYIAVCLFAILVLTAIVYAQGNGRQLSVRVADVTASPEDTLVAVPVFISFSQDSLAGVGIHFSVERNRNLSFASDDVRPDGLLMSVDTAGSIMSGWEMVQAGTPDNSVYSVKLIGQAFWINQGDTPSAAPQDSALLTTLYFRLENPRLLLPGQKFDIMIDPEQTSFSDPVGNSIGIVTTHERRCVKYAGDSCISWKIARVGRMDTTIVGFHNGSITIAGEMPGDSTGGGQEE
jgi:hypothetical protein